MEVIISERGRNLLVLHGYKFRFHKTLANNTERWMCSKNTCKSFLKLGKNEEVLAGPSPHSHEPLEENKLERQKLSNGLKRKASDDICARPSKLIHLALKNNDIETLTRNDISLIKRNMLNARQSKHVNPRSTEETLSAVGNMDIKTNANEDFVIVNDLQSKILGFSTKKNLEALCRSDTVYVDGTFKSCPKYFYQLFTFHALHYDSYVPLAFFLLPNKTVKCYENCFRHLVNTCLNVGLRFSPKNIFIDFEKAIHVSVQSVLTETKIKGCRFHLGQSWYRKIQSIGLARVYASKSEKANFLKSFFGLAFLRPEDVSTVFTDYIMAELPDDQTVTEFCDYVLENYISEEAPFPPQIWAEFSCSANRTTNSCESFHARLNRMFNSPHPNISIFIEVLKGIQSETYIHLRSKSTKKSKTIIEKEIFLREAIADLCNCHISLFEFVKKVSFKFLPINIS